MKKEFKIQEMIKKALIVGINHYDLEGNNLTGCIHDAELLAEVLRNNYSESNKNGDLNFECQLLRSTPDKNKQQITRSYLKSKIKALFEDNNAKVVLLYFSGHGMQNGLGGYLATQDVTSFEEGVSFNELISHANRAMDKEVIIILDCCYSGSMAHIPIQKSRISNIREGVSILAASTANQLSWGNSNGGFFSNLLHNGLKGGSADVLGHVNLVRLYRHVERVFGPWDQRPTLKVNLSSTVILKKVEPQLPISVLEKITNYFIDAEHQIQLDKEFEPSEGNGNKDKETQFGNLQKMANSGLVKPLIQDSMYYAAIFEDKCYLTSVGKQYWEMVKFGLNNKVLKY